MFGLGFTEILFILVVALLVFGPKKLPEVSRSLGRALGELRRTADDFRREIALSDMEAQRETNKPSLRTENASSKLETVTESCSGHDCEHCEKQEKEQTEQT